MILEQAVPVLGDENDILEKGRKLGKIGMLIDHEMLLWVLPSRVV